MRVATVNVTYRTADGVEEKRSEGLSDATPFYRQYPLRILRPICQKLSLSDHTITDIGECTIVESRSYTREYEMVSKTIHPGSPIVYVVYEEIYRKCRCR